MQNKTSREWDFCDQCIFFVACLRKEKREGQGCEVFIPYPYELKKDVHFIRCNVDGKFVHDVRCLTFDCCKLGNSDSAK